MTDIAGRIFAAALRDDLNHQDIDALAEIHNHVTKHIFCLITGNVLDTRTAHLIKVQNPNCRLVGTAVIDPAVTYTDLNDRLTGQGLELLSRFDPAKVWEKI